jgi:hypothetical protein
MPHSRSPHRKFAAARIAFTAEDGDAGWADAGKSQKGNGKGKSQKGKDESTLRDAIEKIAQLRGENTRLREGIRAHGGGVRLWRP